MRRNLLDVRGPILLLVLAFVAAACSGPADGGVGVRSIATDLAFIPPQEAEPAAPAGIVPDADRGPFVLEGEPAERPGAPIPTPPPPPDCPFAPLTAAPEVVAPVDVTDRPEEGRYRWILDGYQETAEFGRVPLGGPVQRSLHDVADAPDGFTFTTREREIQVGTSGTIETTYRVVQDSDLMDDGIYLSQVRRVGRDGQSREFNPSPPVMVFPLPATIGESPIGVGVFVESEQMDTVGVDATTFESLRHSGTITGKMQVDACGELVDSYFVESTQEFVSGTGESFQRRYHYAVATHMGGMLVFEDVATPCPSEEDGECVPEPPLAYEVHIGQLDPDPLPDED